MTQTMSCLVLEVERNFNMHFCLIPSQTGKKKKKSKNRDDFDQQIACDAPIPGQNTQHTSINISKL